MQVIDTANRSDLVDWDAMRAMGYGGVVRYISPITKETQWKIITRAEADGLRSKNVPFELVWEYDARDWTWADGGEHGREAVRQAQALGYEQGKVIYGACDFDLGPQDWAAHAGGYAQAFRDAVRGGGYKVGVYGPWDALLLCSGLGYDAYWQCMSTSFSGGRNRMIWPSNRLRQLRSASVHGLDVDINDCTTDFGTGRTTMSEWLAALRAAAIVCGGEATAEGYTASMGDDDFSKRVAQLNADLYKACSNKEIIRLLSSSWSTAMRAAQLVLTGDPTTEGYTEILGETDSAKAIAKTALPTINQHSLKAVEERLTQAINAVSGGDGPNLQVVIDRIDELEDKFKRLIDAIEKAV